MTIAATPFLGAEAHQAVRRVITATAPIAPHSQPLNAIAASEECIRTVARQAALRATVAASGCALRATVGTII